MKRSWNDLPQAKSTHTVQKQRKEEHKAQIVPCSRKDQEAIETILQFKIHLERLGYSKSSVRMLPSCLKEFLETTAKELHEIQPQDIQNYHQYLQERPNQRRAGGLSESFISHHLYSLRLFFAWQIESGKIAENPISSLEFAPPSSPPREILSTEEINQLYGSCESLKEKAVLSLFYGCGLRRSEGEKLDLKDVHFSQNLLYVKSGKGGKRRAVPMSGKVKNDLRNYAVKERFSKQNEMAFVTNQQGKRTSGDSFNRQFKKLMERAKINKSASLHSLRHSIATHLLESGLSVEYVRDFLGHHNLETTQVYTRIKSRQLWNL